MKRQRFFSRAVVVSMQIVLSILQLFLLNSSTAALASNRLNSCISASFLHVEPNTTLAEINQLLDERDAELLDWFPQINVAVVHFPTIARQDGGIPEVAWFSEILETEYAFVATLERDGWVEGEYVPNDPDVSNSERVYTPEMLELFEGWNYTTGSQDVVIAVIDTGITFSHPEFENRLVPGYDFCNDDDNAADDHGHGTHVSGVIGAAIDNHVGSAGVCPHCRMMPVKVLSANNVGTFTAVVRGIMFAVENGANVITLSLGSPSNLEAVEAAVQYALSQNVFVVAAVGNGRSAEAFYPAAYPDVLSVSATDPSDEFWSLSNYGTHVDIAAPGHLIYSTHPDLQNSYQGHSFMSGTSMATPHVAGLAGLLLSQIPDRTIAELKRLITTTAMDINEPGWDPYTGHGRINIRAALSADTTGTSVEPTTTPLPPSPYTNEGTAVTPDTEKMEYFQFVPIIAK